MNKKFSFIGAGNMASALIFGIDTDICIYDKNTAQYEKFKNKSYMYAKDIKGAIEYGDYIFLCVKPQNFEELLPQIAECDLTGKVIVSIAAGITISGIESVTGKVPIVRTIPNTPLMVGKGVTGICRNSLVNDKQFSEICRLFSTLGEVIVTTEDHINTITAATSSAPAYVYLFIKSIADAAKEMGIEDSHLDEYIARMVLGSCELMLKTKKTPDELIAMVTSPKGTTAEAMRVFDENDFSGIVYDAMKACEERAKELSGM